jgi:hypothetical protein
MLTQSEIRAAMEQARASGKMVKVKAGGGMYLQAKGQSALWSYQFWGPLADGRTGTRSTSLGSIAVLPTWRDAEKARTAFRADKDAGRVPEPRQQYRASDGPTFLAAARSFLEAYGRTVGPKQLDRAEGLLCGHEGEKDSTGRIVRKTFKSPCEPLHKMALSRITTDDVVACIRPIWSGAGDNKGNICRRFIEAVFADNHVDPNPAAWDRVKVSRYGLNNLGTARRNHPAMPLDDFRPWFQSLDMANREHAAIAFYCLTGAGTRRKPMLEARWREIDLDRKVWTVPPQNTKMGVLRLRNGERPEPLVVPLTDAAIACLGPQGGPDDRVFNLGNNHDAMSLKVLFDFQGKDDPEPYADLHGLRSVFRGWCQIPANGIPYAVAESILSHGEQGSKDDSGKRVSKAVSSYTRYTFDAERRTVLEKWAAFCMAR